MITKEELAQMIDGNQYGSETTKEIKQLAKDNNLVIVYGYSDDNIEIEGAIDDEIGAYGGIDIYLNKNGSFSMNEDGEPVPTEYKIECEWAPKKSDFSWLITSKIPSESFVINENDEVFCQGLVFSLSDL